MGIDKIIVTLLGFGFAGFIWWFFLGKKDDEVLIKENEVSLTVDGGYKPSVIKLVKNNTVVIKVIRKDSNSCLEEIVLPDFKIKEYLPLNQEIQLEITPKESGTFGFHCGMNMYQGKIIVI